MDENEDRGSITPVTGSSEIYTEYVSQVEASNYLDKLQPFDSIFCDGQEHFKMGTIEENKNSCSVSTIISDEILEKLSTLASNTQEQNENCEKLQERILKAKETIGRLGVENQVRDFDSIELMLAGEIRYLISIVKCMAETSRGERRNEKAHLLVSRGQR